MAFRKLSWNCYEALETDEQQPDFPRKKIKLLSVLVYQEIRFFFHENSSVHQFHSKFLLA